MRNEEYDDGLILPNNLTKISYTVQNITELV